MYTYRCEVLRVVDADTLDLLIDLGFSISLKARIRLIGIDAPERFTEVGKAATRFVEQWISTKDPGKFSVVTSKDHHEKFGRYLGDLKHDDSPNGLVEALLGADRANVYYGGPRNKETPS